MPTEAFAVDFLEKQEWLGPVEGGLQKAVHTAYDAGGNTGRKVKNFLHGTWLGHPLHPALTDVPLGAWTAAAILDLVDMAGDRSVRAGADAAVKIGLGGAVAAAIAGVTDWQETDGGTRRVGMVHGLLNLAGAGLYTASMIMRGRRERGAGRLLAFLGLGVSTAAAYLGGNLVFSRRVGVNHAAGEPLPEGWVTVSTVGELGEGEMRRVDARGVKVLVARRGGRVYAIAEVCTHLGGPLAEGRLEGATVVCPWHGSRFSLEDGSVVDGPATHPEPCFETRERDGQIEVRPRTRE
jgi:nitrite reductase/ring-hydroxylating ferredoxin subunit/uncharacterized membrane protein